VRVGEKERSEQAAIVARYADLFTRPQFDALRNAEESAEGSGSERERLHRLRKTCEAGIVVAALAAREDALANELLAARVVWREEQLPLRSAQARLAIEPATKPATSSEHSRSRRPPASTPRGARSLRHARSCTPS
jgi:hypothetical protein